ncbi:MAG TPA: CHRD domain-containing protein [Egibacteraceae bacterium]|nr:CHRD domain-containing protein [Egibacteraceae bacterium]
MEGEGRSMFHKAAGTLVVLLFAQLLVALPAAAQDATVDVIDFAFQPDEIRVEPGSTVTWTNHDPFGHTATAEDGSFSVGLQPGQSGSHTFAQEGSFPYFCKLHPEMRGVVQVGAEAPFPEPTVERLQAQDNITAAIAFSQTAFDDGASTYALLARDDVFADSLSSGGAQGRLGAPLLLTPTNTLDNRVRTELQRLGVRTVVMLGGPNALSPDVERALRQAGFGVRRVAGPNRLATAVAIAERFFPTPDTAIVARAFGDASDEVRAFVDSLGAGAAAAATGQPLLLTHTTSLSAETEAYLRDNPIDSVTLVGGPRAVSEAVEEQIAALGIEVERVAGEDRYGTAAELALMQSPLGPPPLLVLVDGTDEDAWASGFPAAALQAPVLLTAGDAFPAHTVQLLMGSQTEGASLVCAPDVTSTACDRAETVANAESFGGEMWRPAVLEPAEGAPAGSSGFAEVLPTPDPGVLCYTWEAFSISGDPTAAHIHRASDGQPVVDLSLESGPFGFASNCAYDVGATLAGDIVANPRDYYVNIHTEAHPDGEISGELLAPTGAVIAEMFGEAEIPGPGDPDAVGFAFLLSTDRPDELCSFLGVFDLDPPATAAHVHEGGVDEAGPPVIDLPVPAGPAPFAVGCQQALDAALVADVMAGDGGHYVNVHNATFPDGAIRGQLINPFGGPPEGGAAAASTDGDVSRELAERSPRYRSWTR